MKIRDVDSPEPACAIKYVAAYGDRKTQGAAYHKARSQVSSIMQMPHLQTVHSMIDDWLSQEYKVFGRNFRWEATAEGIGVYRITNGPEASVEMNIFDDATRQRFNRYRIFLLNEEVTLSDTTSITPKAQQPSAELKGSVAK